MSWFSELAGKAENLLNNLDERTASAFQRQQKSDVLYAEAQAWLPRQVQSRRPVVRPAVKKQLTETRSSYSPSRKSQIPPCKPVVKGFDPKNEGKTSPAKKTLKKTFDGSYRVCKDDKEISHDYGSYRRKSFPSSKEVEDIVIRSHKVESMGVENQMLKNEVVLCNQEIADLLDRTRTMEFDLREAHAKNDNLEKLYRSAREEKETLSNEIAKMKEKSPPEPEYGPEYSDLSSAYRALEKDFADVNDRNRELQTQLKELEMGRMSTSSIQMKLENDLRFAHMTLNDLRADLEKSRNECHRVQTDWDSYKLRVKNLLLSKDKEIVALQKNPEQSEGAKMLAEQVDHLREDRDQLSANIKRLEDELKEANRRVEQVEVRAHGAERLVSALREALREERQSKNKAENQCIIYNKALKNLQMETTHQIANLQAAIQDKDIQIQKYKAATKLSVTSVCPASETSALNVAECDRTRDTVSSEKIQLLTQSLIAKQGRIDVLLAENNTLKLNIETLEEAHRRELAKLKSNQIIQVHDGDACLKTKLGSGDYVASSVISKASLRIGVMMRRHPVFRTAIILYMAALHVWVMVVLLTYTPEVH